MTNPLYPIFLNIKERRCVVVGAGTVGARKIAPLVECGARVVVVAPKCEAWVAEWRQAGRLEWLERGFCPQDLDGACLVVAAAGDPAVNEQVFAEADRRGIPCNVVDQPALCHFFVPSVAHRGDLKIAFSTNGKSPVLAAALRRRFEEILGEDFARVVELAGRVRERIQEQYPDAPRQRMERVREVLRADELIEAVLAGDAVTQGAIVDSWKSCLSE
jgi:siroheme synthase-like protein